MQDSIAGGHVQLVTMLRSRGASISDSLSATKLCDAAFKRDVKILKLLVDCAGLQASTILLSWFVHQGLDLSEFFRNNLILIFL